MDNAECPAKSLLTGPMISITVGPDRKKWTLHRDLLSFHSPYFASRPNSEDQQLEFLDASPAGWSLLVKYLYQGFLPPLSQFATSTDKYDHAVACHKLYILSSRFSMPYLQNIAMDRFRACLHATHLVPDAEEIQEMYTSSPKDSGMRILMIRIAARQIMDPETTRDVRAYHGCFEAEPGFAVDLVREIRNTSGGMLFGDPTSGKGCEFHEHAKGEDCDSLRREDGPDTEEILSHGLIAVAESVSKTTPRKLKPKVPSTTSDRSPDTSSPIRPSTTASSSTRQPSLRKPDSSIKLNGVGSKVRFVATPKSPRFKDRDDSITHYSPNRSKTGRAEALTSASDISRDRVAVVSCSPRRSPKPSPQAARPNPDLAMRVSNHVSQEGDSGSPVKLPQDVPNMTIRGLSNAGIHSLVHVHKASRSGLVDSIVNQYDSLISNGSDLEPRGKPVWMSTTKRKPPKLRQQQHHPRKISN